MIQRKSSLLIVAICQASLSISMAQTSASYNLTALPATDRSVYFGVAETGVSKPIIWGLDTAWPSEDNIRRGVAFMGAERVDVVRASFQPTLPLVNGDLQTQQVTDLNYRLGLIDLTGAKTKVVLNCDHPSVDASYIGNAVNWAKLIDVTAKRVQDRGRTIVAVSPFNEPDYGWGQYTGNGQTDFYNIAVELRKNSRFDSIRISGGNTLNCDQALPWYNALKSKLDEGNTHQLAGSFDNFASFYTNVRANGDHASGDELHNVMEAMVGVEYGMQTGIWWGTAERARGEFVKASDGVRLGYAEHRPNWTAASVYRAPDGKVQAFGGTSERQAVTTTYRFVSKDRDVFFDGQGPQREYTISLPGGTGYQNGQTNAERVVNITWGADIQPVVNGKYILVNRNSGKVIEVANGSTTAGASLRQNAYTTQTYQQWNVTPVDSRIGGDFSYFTLTAVHSGKAMDLLNWSLSNGGGVIAWDDSKGANQQWYLEYAGDGWFYIRSRHSAKCLDVSGSSLANTAAVNQWDFLGRASQQWRLIPVGAPVEFVAPAAPTDVAATADGASVRLDWTASTDTDVSGYTIFRSDSTGKNYNTLARDVKTRSFVDNTAQAGKTYYYVVKAVDNSLNRSAYSNEVSAALTNARELVARYAFDGNTLDSTVHLNHAATYAASYLTGKIGPNSLALNGSSSFVQLPSYVANSNEMTIATWVYWTGSSSGQRIFDFGNSQTEYMYLTPKKTLGGLCFGINNNGSEQYLNTTALTSGKWMHVAVTLGSAGVSLYVNGALAATSTTIAYRPSMFKPAINYIGRSQFSNPLLSGMIDDFRIYNYAMTAAEIAEIPGVISGLNSAEKTVECTVYPQPASDKVRVTWDATGPVSLSLYSLNGSLVQPSVTAESAPLELKVSNLSSGVYVMKLNTREESLIRKILVRH